MSHDRAFLRGLDRCLMMLHDGTVLALPDFSSAPKALVRPESAADVRLAKAFTTL